jgi:AraC family transcriptional regulator, regulatory protein of adaptative response / DNA-3-methyladenine glycosylase II
MRLIGDGVVERDGVGGLARRLGYSERHLNRLLTDEVGAGPLAVARARRAQTARILIETTALSLTDVAFAAGFGSVRQFNDTVRDVFDATPSSLRAAARRRGGRRSVPPDSLTSPRAMTGGSMSGGAMSTGPITVSMRLATRRPFAGRALLRFLALRAIPGVEAVEPSGAYRRLLMLPGGPAAVTLTLPASLSTDPSDIDHVVASVRVTDWADLSTAVQRVRRLLDLDADPVAVDTHLSADRVLAPLVLVVPGRRSPGSVDPVETLVRAIVGQQISVAGARTVIARIVAAIGSSVDPELVAGWDGLSQVFPSAERVADAPDDAFSMPAARRDTIRRAAGAIAEGTVALDIGADPVMARTQLMSLKGIGPWTADYTVMRALGDPDVMLATDLGVLHAATALKLDDLTAASRRWSPWRSYAVHHLWASLDVVRPAEHEGSDPSCPASSS